MGLIVKGGSWGKATNFKVKTNSGWKNVKKAFVKTLNGWASFWPKSGPVALFEVDLSSSKSSYPSSGTSYPVLTGTTYHWDSTSTISLSYAFQSSSSSYGPWTNINSGSYIANPQSGSTSSVTYTPALNDYPSGTTYFNFVVTATDGNNNSNASSSASQYDIIITLPAPTWTSTIPRLGGKYATGQTITWNVGKATIGGSSSSVGYYTTIYKSSPTGTITYLYGNSTTPDFESTDDYQYSISIPTTDSGYTYYFTTYAAQSLILNPTSSITYSNNATIIVSPAIVTNPSITKYDGYQTVGYRLQGNTGTWNQPMTDYFWQWGYCSTNSTNLNDYSLMYNWTSGPFGYTWTPYNGTDTSENQNHTLTIPQYTYAYGSTTPISLAGKYINFYSNADIVNGGVYQYANQSPVQSVGPIYNAPGTAGAPVANFSRAYSASYAYIKFYWTDATYYKTYTVQYNNSGAWTDLGSTNSSTYNGSFISPLELLVPVGTWDFRVKTVNDEAITTYSSTTSFTVSSPYNFAFGNTIYPSTNGQIGLDSGWSLAAISPSGRTIGVYGLDLYQQSVGYWSDGRYFVVQYSGWAYGQTNVPAYAIRYQVRFDTLNTNYVDVLICNKGSSLLQPTYVGYYASGSLQSGVSGPYLLATNSSYRIYFDGTTGTLGNSFTQIPSADFVTASLSSGTVDDGYSTITTASNQYTPSYFSGVSGSIASNTLSVSFTGNIDYSYYYYRLDTVNYGGTNFANAMGGTANPLNISNLNPGTRYYLTFIPYNSLGQAGTTYQNYYDVPNAPSAFTTISGTKAYPTGATQSSGEPSQTRSLSASWNASTNAYYYEVQYEGSIDNSSWTVLRSLSASPLLTTTSDTYPALYYRYYRFAVRATPYPYSITYAAYSDGGSLGSLQYRYMTGSAPTAPSIGTITKTYNSASIPFTINSGGSNTVDWIQYSTDQFSWTNTYFSPLNLSSLSASTSYTYYFRALNYDQLTSSNATASFTTDAQPVYYTVTWNANGGSVSPSSSTQSTVGGSVTAPTPTLSGYSFNGWYNASSGGSLIVNAGGSYTPSSNTTLYAQWTVSATAPNPPTSVAIGSLTYAYASGVWPLTVSVAKSGSGNNLTYAQTWTYGVQVNFPISWTAPSGGTAATGYDIYYNSTGTAPTSSTSASYTSTSTSYTDYWYQLDRNTTGTYYYWVRAKNAQGSSSWVSAGSKASVATVVSGLVIGLYLSTASSTRIAPSSPPANTALAYTWTSVLAGSHRGAVTATIAGTAVAITYSSYA